jgi:ABC-type glycerol-3-phosphate transport system permease component
MGLLRGGVIGATRDSSRAIRRRLAAAAGYSGLIGVGIVLVLPLAWAALASVQPLDEVYAYPPSWWTSSPQWSNFTDAVRRLPFLRFMLNSCLIAFPAVAGAVLTSAMAGYAFARLPWRGKGFWFVVLLASMMIPSQVLLIPHFLIFKSLGWVGTYKPLIVPAWLGGGAFNVFLSRQFFRSLPRELEEAALLDGASRCQTFSRVLLPAAKPVVATAATLSFVIHWQEFFRPLIYLNDFRTYPIALGLRMYQSVSGSWVNLLMAASLLALLPVAAVFVIGQRYLARGLQVSRPATRW